METIIKESTVLLERIVIRSPAKVDSRQKFINLINNIINRTGVEQLGDCIGRDTDPDLFITINELNELKLLTGELKICNTMHSVNEIQLKDLLIVLERSIRLGCGKSEFSSSPETVCPREKQFDYVSHELAMQAMTAVFTVLNIITSDNVPSNIYIEDVINRVLQFISYQLQHAVVPFFDPFYRLEQKTYERSYSKKEINNIKILYRNLLEVIELYSKIIELKLLPERTLNLIVTLAGGILIVDNVEELYSCAIKILGKMFEKYGNSKNLVSRVLSFMVTTCDSKLGKRSYKINPTCKITTVTALILELIQCYLGLPIDSETKVKFKKTAQEKYDVAVSIAGDFILTFFNTCVDRKGETNSKKKFKAFIEDLLVLVDRPEWPASEMLLYLLCNLFVYVLKSKQANVQSRTMCLEYLGLIISTMQRYKIESQSKLPKMCKLIQNYKEQDIFGNMNKKLSILPIEVQRRLFLQYIVIHYLKHGQHMDYCISDPTNYNLLIWYKDIEERIRSKRPSENSNKKPKYCDIPGEEKNSSESINSSKIEKMILKTNLLSVGRIVCPITKRPLVEYNDTKIICKYLNSKRYFSESYQIYLKHIFCALSDSSIQVQSTAMKSIAMVVDTEPELLNDTALENFVSRSLSHTSISVREAALNLIGKYVLRQPGIVDKYHNVLIANVLDSGISVRKRAIKILKEICLTNTKFSKITEVCKVLVGRVSDEGIKKMILQFFHELWFTKTEEELLMDKVVSILKVVATFESSHFQEFGMLLWKLLHSKEGIDSKEASLSCQKIANTIINIIVSDKKQGKALMDVTDKNKEQKLTENVVSCFAVLAVISKTDPQLLVPHAFSLQPFLYFDVKKEIKEIYKIISSVLEIMEAIVPVIDHPSDLFVTKIEEACINIILQQNGDLMKPAFSCLSVIINKVTYNYKLIKDLLIKFLRHTIYFKACHLKNSKDGLFNTYQHYLRRCLLLLGYSFQYFDLSDKMETKDQYDFVKKNSFEVLVYFSKQIEADVRKMALRSLGSFCIRYSSCMLLPEIKELYQNILSSQVVHVHLPLQVLCTFQEYLKDVEHQLVFQDGKLKKNTERENLKQLGEEWSEITAKIFQLHIKNILAAYNHSYCPVRYGVFQIIQMLISQGILNPVTFVPHLICAATEDVHVFKQSAETELRKVTLKYPYAMKSMAVKGILLSQEVQCSFQDKKVLRGVNQNNIAVNNVVYDIIQTTRNSRHNFTKNVLQLFNKEDISIQKLIYVCDNLASFTYQILDEVLFLIYQIDIIMNVNGNNILLCFEEALIPVGSKRKENLELVLKRMPESFEILRNCIKATERYELLLLLRQYIKKAYNIDDIKLVKYKPSEPLNLYDKPIRRNMTYKFNPESILWRLSGNNNLSESNEKKNLAVRYLEFKKLMEDELQDSDASLSGDETKDGTYIPPAEENKQKITSFDSATKKRPSPDNDPPNKKKRTH